MKKLLIILTILSVIIGCGTTHHTPSTDTNVHYEIRDSIRYIDSLVPIPIPVERIVDVVPVYDTLKLETSVAKAQAYVDTTTHTIKGCIENKKDSIKTVIKFKDRKVVEYRDSVVVKTVPVEVKVEKKVVPSWCWWLLGINILILILIGIRLYLKFSAHI